MQSVSRHVWTLLFAGAAKNQRRPIGLEGVSTTQGYRPEKQATRADEVLQTSRPSSSTVSVQVAGWCRLPFPRNCLPALCASSRAQHAQRHLLPQRKASLMHRPMALLEQICRRPLPWRRRQKEHPDFPWSGGARSVTEAVPAAEMLSVSAADREGAVVPGRQWGRPSPGARGRWISHSTSYVGERRSFSSHRPRFPRPWNHSALAASPERPLPTSLPPHRPYSLAAR